jgi:predicted transposase YdaD
MAPTSTRPDYDQTLKRLFARAHEGMLALLLPGAHWLGERSPELTARLRRADLVWNVALASGERLLLHVELQTKPDHLIGERVAEYGLRLWRQAQLPVHSVVIYLRERGGIPASPFVIERGGGEEGLRYRYSVIRLWEEPAEQVLAMAEPGAWPLATLMRGEPLATLETVAERLAQAALPPGEREELTGLLAVLAGMRVPRPVVEQVLRRNPMIREILGESSVAAIWRDEGKAKWKEVGKAEGKAEGLAEGEAKGQRTLVQALLESRFGPLDAAEVAALQEAKEPLLRALAPYIVTDSREQVRARLGVA